MGIWSGLDRSRTAYKQPVTDVTDDPLRHYLPAISEVIIVSSARCFLFRLVPGLVVAIAFAAQADTIRCSTALIREGATVLRIRENCGEPATIESAMEPVYAQRPDGTPYQAGTVRVEYWYYDFGSRRNPVRMTIKGGVAEKIERLRRNQ